jgi:hypothetical protein
MADWRAQNESKGRSAGDKQHEQRRNAIEGAGARAMAAADKKSAD